GDLQAQLLPAGGGQGIEARPALGLALTPLRGDPTLEQEPLQGGVERALLDLEHLVAALADQAGDAVAVQRAAAQGFEDHQVQGSGQQRWSGAGRYGASGVVLGRARILTWHRAGLQAAAAAYRESMHRLSLGQAPVLNCARLSL